MRAGRGYPRAIGIALLALAAPLAACGGSDELPQVVGTLERDRLELKAETDDPIIAIAAREGDQLEAGELILRLDAARLTTQLERGRGASSEAAFTPHFALTERDRSRLAYLAEIELEEDEALGLPTGVPVEVRFPGVRDAFAGDTGRDER